MILGIKRTSRLTTLLISVIELAERIADELEKQQITNNTIILFERGKNLFATYIFSVEVLHIVI